MNKRKVMMLALSLCMVAILAVGGTLAFFTDTDSKTNVFTVGNVQIEQYETDRNGASFVDGQKLFPIVNDGKDSEGYHTGKNYIDKIVTVKNTGTEAAYVRTHIAFPIVLDNNEPNFDASENILHWNGASAADNFAAANKNQDNDWYWDKNLTTDWPGNGGAWNYYFANVGGVDYVVYVATHKSAVEAGKTTAPSLLGVYLDAAVDFNGEKYTKGDFEFTFPAQIKILVLSEATQAEGFVDANDALDQSFGKVGTYNPWEE